MAGAAKTEKNLDKAMQARRKDEKKTAKKARNLLTKEAKAKAKEKTRKDTKEKTKKEKAKQRSKVGLVAASNHFQKAGDNLLGLPPLLWPLVIFVGFQVARNTYEKRRQEQDLAEARRFLKESRGFR